MVRPEILQRRLQKLGEYLKLLRGYRENVSRADLDDDPTVRGSIERYLQLAAESMIDIGSHVAADASLVAAEDYKGTFSALEKSGIIPSDFATRLRGWAGFRNILVHEYLEVDLDKVWHALQDELGDIEQFIATFSRFLE